MMIQGVSRVRVILMRCGWGCLLFGALAASTVDAENLASFERLGAGVPGGWHAVGDNYTWDADPASGPAGQGAARIQFAGRGEVTVQSPAMALDPEAIYAVACWLRSDPPGASITLTLNDNEGNASVFSAQPGSATKDWALHRVQGALPASPNRRYYLEMSAHGENATLWIDGLCLTRLTSGQDTAAPSLHPSGVTVLPVAPWGLVTGNAPLEIRARVVDISKPGCRLALHFAHTTGLTAD